MLCCAVLSFFNHAQLFATLWTINCQAPLSMGFSSQGYWSGLPCPPWGTFLTRDPNLQLLQLLQLLRFRQILYCWATREAQPKNTLIEINLYTFSFHYKVHRIIEIAFCIHIFQIKTLSLKEFPRPAYNL